MKPAKIGFFLLSVVLMPLSIQAEELPFLTPEEAVSMAITPRNNVKNTLKQAVPAEVVGLNRSFSSKTIWEKRNQLLKQNNLATQENYPLVADTPEAVSDKIIAVMDLNQQPEDFIHLLAPIEDAEETTEEPQEEQKEAEKTSERNELPQENIASENQQQNLEIEDHTVKHISLRRRFGQ